MYKYNNQKISNNKKTLHIFQIWIFKVHPHPPLYPYNTAILLYLTSLKYFVFLWFLLYLSVYLHTLYWLHKTKEQKFKSKHPQLHQRLSLSLHSSHRICGLVSSFKNLYLPTKQLVSNAHGKEFSYILSIELYTCTLVASIIIIALRVCVLKTGTRTALCYKIVTTSTIHELN